MPKWWNKELKNEKEKVSKLARKAFHSKVAEDWKAFKSAQKIYMKNIHAAKRKSWKEFTSKVSTPTEMSKLMKVLTFENKNKSIGLLKNNNGYYCNNPQEVAKLLLDTHVPESIELSETDESDGLISEKMCYDCELEGLFITEQKVKLAFQSFGPDKAAGPDGIKPLVLWELNDFVIKRITKLFRACLTLSYTPVTWRKSSIIFIPKAGKDNYEKASSFRPITLTSFLFKTLERLVQWEIEEHISLSPSQHAFRQGYSTETALSSLCTDIESAIFRQEVALGVFLDIEGAFPNVKNSLVVRAMKDNRFQLGYAIGMSNTLKIEL